MPIHKVLQGECISSIAADYGFDYQTIWNLGENSGLRAKRKNPDVLLPDDLLNIPDKTTKKINASSGIRHRFKLKNVPAELKLRLLDNGKARAGEPYLLEVDGTLFNSATDGDGAITHPIHPGAVSGTLLLKNGTEKLNLNFGSLDPITETRGLQARLNSLGFYCGDVDGICGRCTRNAVARFQYVHDLKVDGDPGPVTQQALQSVFGC